MQEEQKNTNLPAGKKYTPSDILKFVIPSLIGIILFMLPIKEYDPEINQDKITIPIAFVASFIQNQMIISKNPQFTGISARQQLEFTTHLLLTD
jgi:transporter gate domain protein